MSAFSIGEAEGISFGVSENGQREGRARVAAIELTVLETVSQKHCEMDTLNWCGCRSFVVGGLDAAKELHAKLGKQIKSWEALAEAGQVAFK